jgi:hypothetical protein
MGRVASILAVLVLVSSLITGCGCLAADSYEKPACQKYRSERSLDHHNEKGGKHSMFEVTTARS